MTEEKAVRPKTPRASTSKKARLIKPEHYELCVKVAGGMKPSDAAKEMGWHPKTGFALIKRPEVAECLAKMKAKVNEKLVSKGAAEIVKEMKISVGFLDEQLALSILNSGAHSVRGDSDKLKGIELGYKVLEHPAFMPAHSINNNVVVNTPGGQFSVYRAAWKKQPPLLDGATGKEITDGQ